MRGVSHIKRVADIRTAVSARLRSTSRHRATSYMEVMALGMDKLRLEDELSSLSRRDERVRRRLAEVNTLLGARLSQVQGNGPSGPEALSQRDRPASHRGPWRRMTVEY